MSLAENLRIRSRTGTDRNKPLSLPIGGRWKAVPHLSPSPSLFSTDDVSSATVDSHPPGAKREEEGMTPTTTTKAGPEGCAMRVFVRVRPFTQRELTMTSAGGESTPSSTTTTGMGAEWSSLRPMCVVRVEEDRCLSHITTLDPERQFAPKDTYAFEGCFSAVGAGVMRSLEEGEGGDKALSPQEVAYSMQDQALLYVAVAQPVLQSVLEGYNGCVFAYGQTGSGKTYTMMGLPTWGRVAEVARPPCGPCLPLSKPTSAPIGASQKVKKLNMPSFRGATEELGTPRVTSAEVSIAQHSAGPNTSESTVCSMEGIIPRLLRQLFLELLQKHQTDSTHSFRVEIEYYEIYNEKVIDLLSTETQSVELRVRNSPNGPYVDGLRRIHVEDVVSVFKCLQHGNVARHSAATRFNEHSSRSHAILTLHLVQMHISGDDARSRLCSKINLVDLAGSERTGASGVVGKQFIESTKINLSLTVLGRVIDALADLSQGKQGTFCPYRDSNLTWLLRDSLGGNSKTTMIATISPHSSSFDETCQTLRYASRAKQIVTKAIVNEDPQQRLIKQLKMEVELLRRLLEGEEDKGKDDYVDELRDRVVSLEAELNEKKARLGRAEAEIALLRTTMETSKMAVSLSSSGGLTTADASSTKGVISALRSSVEKLEEENLRLLLTETELQTCKDEKTQLEKRIAQVCKNSERESKSLQSSIRRLERENHKLESNKAKLLKLNADLQASEERETELMARIHHLEQENKPLKLGKRRTTPLVHPKSLEISEGAKKKLQLLGLLQQQSDTLFFASDAHDDASSLTKLESLVESLIELAFKAGRECSNGSNRKGPSLEQRKGSNSTSRAVQKGGKISAKSKSTSEEHSKSLENTMSRSTGTPQPFCRKATLRTLTKTKGDCKTETLSNQLLERSSSSIPVLGGKRDVMHHADQEVEKLEGVLKSSSLECGENDLRFNKTDGNAIHQQEAAERVRLLQAESSETLALTTTYMEQALRPKLDALQGQLNNACCEHEAHEKHFQESIEQLQKQVSEVTTQKKDLGSQYEKLKAQMNTLSTENNTLSNQVTKMHQESVQLSVSHRAAIEHLKEGKNELQVLRQAEVESLKAELECVHKAHAQTVKEMEQVRNTLQCVEKTLFEREDRLQKTQQQLNEIIRVKEEKKALLVELEDTKTQRQQYALELSEAKAEVASYKSESIRMQKELQGHINDLSKRLEEAQNHVEVLKFEIEKKSKQHKQVTVEQQETIHKLKEELQHAVHALQEKERIACEDAKELSRLRGCVETLERDQRTWEHEKEALTADLVRMQTTLDQEAHHNLEALVVKDTAIETLQRETKCLREEKMISEEALRQQVGTAQASLSAATVALRAKERELLEQTQSLQADMQLRGECIATLEAREQELRDKLRLQISRSIQLVSEKDAEIMALRKEEKAALDRIADLEERITIMDNDKKGHLEQRIKQQDEYERRSKELEKSSLDMKELKKELHEARKKFSEREASLLQVKERLESELRQKATELNGLRAALKKQSADFEKELTQLKHEGERAVVEMRVLQQEYDGVKDELKERAAQLQYTEKVFKQYQSLMSYIGASLDDRIKYLADLLSQQALDTIEANRHLKEELHQVSQEHTYTSNQLKSLQKALEEEKLAHAAKLQTLLAEVNQLSSTCSQKEVQLQELTQRVDIMRASHEIEETKWREEVTEKAEMICRLKGELERSEKQQASTEGCLEEQRNRLRDETKNFQVTLEKQQSEIAELKEYLEFQANLDLCEAESSRNASFCKQPAGYSATPANMTTAHSVGGSGSGGGGGSGGVATTPRSRVGGVLMSLFQRRGGSATMSTAAGLDPVLGVGESAGATMAIHLSKESKHRSKSNNNSFAGNAPSRALSMSVSLHDFITSQSAYSPDTAITNSHAHNIMTEGSDETTQ